MVRLLASFLVTACLLFPAAPPRSPEVAGAIRVLDSWIQATAREREEPGLSIGIVYDQELIWAKGYGFADLEKHIPASPATLYRIASVSKLFTSSAIMQLRDAGKLRLDDPVSQYLPWFRIPNVTIRHLITHTSGLPRELDIPYWNDLHFPSREEMIRLVPELKPVFPPETVFKYSNLALAIAGEVVAAASGEPFQQYIERHILGPLAMRSTRVHPDAATPSLAIGYRKRVPGQPREREDFIDAGGLTPAANLASSVEDLAKFCELQFRDAPAGGAQILRGATLREMRRVEWLQKDWQSGQALGFWIRKVGDRTRFGHDGSVPGYKSQIEMDGDTKMAAIVLINGYEADPLFYVNQAFAIVGPALAKAAEKPKPTPTPDPSWQKYVGTYSWKHVDVEIMLIAGELTMVSPDATNPWDSRVKLAAVGPDTFKISGGSQNGELVKFDLDASGKVTKLTAGSYYRIKQ
jgi:CubicO group peptidase (beta-lactamase class C family)